MNGELSFTLRATGRLNLLTSEVVVFPPFAPGSKLPEGKRITAVWDTGASRTSVVESVVKELNLPTLGPHKMITASAEVDTSIHMLSVALPNRVIMPNIQATMAPGLLGGYGMLIGMDILTQGDFAVTNLGGKTVFSFRLPSVEEIDFVKEKADFSQNGKIGRNDPCPCGSGRKFKHCKSYHAKI